MTISLRFLIVSFFCALAASYVLKSSKPINNHHEQILVHRRSSSPLFIGVGPEYDVPIKKIEEVITANKIVLFMKGNKIFPQCGFSNTACRILDSLETPYETVDVLADEGVRSAIKLFSQWPTIPQLYIEGEFVGGSDIMIELYQNGELAEMIELANAN
jgi:monothiol glutaredoxin